MPDGPPFILLHFTALQQEISRGLKDCIYSFLLLVITDNNLVLDPYRQAALGRQDLSCMYPTCHEVETVNVNHYCVVLLSFLSILLLLYAHAHVL